MVFPVVYIWMEKVGTEKQKGLAPKKWDKFLNQACGEDSREFLDRVI